jgi:hypothetical protein
VFEKFLGGAPKPEEPSKLKSGQKGYRKPKHLCKRPPRYDERHDPETGWLKPSTASARTLVAGTTRSGSRGSGSTPLSRDARPASSTRSSTEQP